MRKYMILLVFLLCSCSAAQKKLLHPSLTLPEFDVCLLDVKYPDQLFCKNVFNYQGKVKEYTVKLNHESAWMTMTVDDFAVIVGFMRQYCKENRRACGVMAKRLRRYDKRR